MVVGTVSIVATTEPCRSGFGKYDVRACFACADGGENKGPCCDDIYRHSWGRNPDIVVDCQDTQEGCWVGKGWCLPGLICVVDESSGGRDFGACQLKEQQSPTPAPAVLPPSMVVPESPATIIQTVPPAVATAASSLLTLRSSSTSNTTKSGHFFVVVGLLGAAMMAVKVVLQRRHRGLFLRRHLYNEVDATAIRIDV